MQPSHAKRLIGELTKERPTLQLTRAVPNKKDFALHQTAFAEHATSWLRLQGGESSSGAVDEAEPLAAGSAASAVSGGGLSPSRTERQWREHFTERVRMEIAKPIHRTFAYTVPSGSRVFGLPYDRDWSEGGGVGFLARFDGKCYTVSSGDGFCAAGIGFYLSTNEALLAAITPGGAYDFNCSCLDDRPSLRSRGGMGMTIYANNDPVPLMSRQPVLWSFNGITPGNPIAGSGLIADASSPVLGFGPVRLAPMLLNMVPGARYLVWVWCWQTAQNRQGAPLFAFLKFNMPFVSVDAGPPIIVK